jgi:hypothetical protein
MRGASVLSLAVRRAPTLLTGIRVLAHLAVGQNETVGNAPGAIFISDLSCDDVSPIVTGTFTSAGYIAGAQLISGGCVDVMTDTSALVRSRVQISQATTVIYINTRGFTDNRGKDS